MPFLLVGLFKDTAAYHKVYVSADEFAFCLCNNLFYGSCAGTAVRLFCRLGYGAAAHGGSRNDADAGGGFSVQCLSDVQKKGHDTAMAY